MKKALLFILTLIIIISLASCSTPPEDPADESTKYTVTWIDDGGKTLKTEELTEGTPPSYTYNPVDTAQWDYTFLGWSATSGGEVLSTLPAISADTIYYASVSKVLQKYTVSFDTGDGSAVPNQTVDYGSKASEPEEAPTLTGFRFMGWSTKPNEFSAVDFDAAIVGNVTFYAMWNEDLDLKGELSSMLNGYDAGPESFIPQSMLPGFGTVRGSSGQIITDYSSFVNISGIKAHGHGEQWNMVLENIQQSELFFDALNTVEGIITTSVGAFNNYIDSNPKDSASYTFASGIYNVTVKYEGGVLYYLLDYTATFPLIGEQTAQIAVYSELGSGTKCVRVQLGDANALTYTVTENSYEFAIRYGGVRRAYFSISRNDDGTTTGHIYEHLGVGNVWTSSAADFYITDEYVSVVGSKANAFLGSAGYINELYDAETGMLLGYEVKEEVDVPLIGLVTYNTLWFHLDEIDGIESIKYVEANDSTAAAFYINGSSTAWKDKLVGGFSGKMGSRRFDIEFRTQYFYTWDASSGKYVKVEAQVPMLFVQEENLDELAKDVLSTNGVSIDVRVSSTDLDKILTDYETLIPAFIEIKDLVTVDVILEFIGTKITFG